MAANLRAAVISHRAGLWEGAADLYAGVMAEPMALPEAKMTVIRRLRDDAVLHVPLDPRLADCAQSHFDTIRAADGLPPTSLDHEGPSVKSGSYTPPVLQPGYVPPRPARPPLKLVVNH